METSNSICYLADDAMPPAPMVLSLCTMDLFFIPRVIPWATETLSHSGKLKPLAGKLRRTRFAPYPLPSCQFPSVAKDKRRDPTSIPPTLHASATPIPWRNKEKGRESSISPCDDEPPLDDDVSDEESTEELLPSSRASISRNSHPTIQRVLIAQPKGVGILGLVQLGTKLNWEGDTYQRIVKHAKKIFPVYLKMETSASGQDQASKDAFKDAMMQEFDDLLSNYVNVWPLKQIMQCLCKKFSEKTRKQSAKRTMEVVQTAVVGPSAPRKIS
ncbi:hypothetical protein IW262DRAFT_1299665 [Armillaria fumosa]|nr:hypothetical protein IW262DRAFT_1299665 [Armillaria fumosa]